MNAGGAFSDENARGEVDAAGPPRPCFGVGSLGPYFISVSKKKQRVEFVVGEKKSERFQSDNDLRR